MDRLTRVSVVPVVFCLGARTSRVPVRPDGAVNPDDLRRITEVARRGRPSDRWPMGPHPAPPYPARWHHASAPERAKT